MQPAPPSAPLQFGDSAPWFTAPALSGSATYAFDTVAGRHVLMLFFGSAGEPRCRDALRLVAGHRALFDDCNACFFGVTADPEDAGAGRIAQQLPGIRFFLDFDCQLSARYGAAAPAGEPHWLVLDPLLRVAGRFGLEQGEQAIALLRSRIADAGDEAGWAPVLRIPDVLEPELCRHLIALYEAAGGEESGFMRDVDGRTVLIVDASHKQRRDHILEDEAVRRDIVTRMRRRLNPMMERAFQFRATRIERYLIACYEAGRGHFRPHRDNTTKGTAHRRFAVTINLNQDYEGGDLRFPEFGPRTYRAPTGGAIVFSCSLLHEATPVTRGRRFAFLPFLYDEEGARIREANNHHLGPGVGPYKASG